MAIRLTCACGKTLKVDDKYRGKKIKCPACGERLIVEEGDDTGVQADEPKKRPVKVADERDDDEDDEDREERSPRKKKVAQRSMVPWILGGCGVLTLMTCCLVSAGVGVWYFWFRGPADDLIYVHDGVAGFVSFRAGDIWKSQVVQDQLKKLPAQAKADMDKQMKEMETKSGMRPEDVERFTVIFRSFDNAPLDMDFVMTMKTTRAMDRKKILDAMTKEKGLTLKDVKDGGVTIHLVEGGGANAMAFHFPSDRVMVVAQKEATLKDVLKQAKKSPKSAALTRGVQMASSGRHQLVAAFEISGNLLNKVPPEAWKQAPNLRDMNGVIFAGTLTKDLALEMVLTFPTSAKAASAKKDVDELKALANQGIKAMGPKIPAAATKFMESVTIDQRSAEVVATAKLELDLDAFGPMNPFLGGFGGGGGGGFGPGPANRITSINNLKQIGLAMHSFHDVQRKLPNHAILHPKTGQPLLSWRVAILPYINEGALYNQIHRDEPWDSAHNRQFWNRMPIVYQLPGKPNDGRTYYQVFRSMPGSLDSAFPQRLPPKQPFGEGGPMNLAGMTDGTSNTILTVESAISANWMQPDDIIFQSGPGGFPVGRLGNHWGDNSFLAGMGDGTVRRFQRAIAPTDLQALITARGGEVIDIGRWEAR
jgi:hypothetical protein